MLDRRRIAVRRCGALSAALVLCLGLSQSYLACAQTSSASSWKAVLSAALKEGKVVLYASTVPDVQNRIRADFERAYPGVTPEFHRFSGGPMITKLEQERKTGAEGADVAITTDANYFVDLASEGRVRAPSGPSVDTWPGRYLIRRTIPVLALEPLVIAYNTKQVTTRIAGYGDLLKSELAARIGTNDLVATTMVAFYDWLEKTQGPGFNAKFASQKPRIYFGSPSITQALASGEVAVAAVTTVGSAGPLIAQGAPIKVVVPNPAFGYGYVASILAWSKRPNAAQVLVDYLLSYRGQRTLVGQGEAASPRPDIPESLDANSVFVYDPSEYPPDAVKAYREKWDLMFKR